MNLIKTFIWLLMIIMNVLTIIVIYSDVTGNNFNSSTIIVPLVVVFLDVFAFYTYFIMEGDL
ncbi:hypothetical protein H3T72_gp15 [Enterococcus phage vB_EfaP_Ef7.3]|uniref:Transmembrane protein n=1 Tax=Enterococcus phage vB_EfaP_Ef7.3 TaxID=2546619 RepID=A0A4D6DT12_9CAUD|nr:hypothetical protein H3T72_gp15 [Enterococcus phage vB_EfaP_Ef7.3]QBZ69066.1 hypothetical protein [Enterococcus phage vB_EfaP_Ef7.3]